MELHAPTIVLLILALTHALVWGTLSPVIQVCTCILVVSAVGFYLINPLASLHSAQGLSHINWDQQVLLVEQLGLACSLQTTSKDHTTLPHWP